MLVRRSTYLNEKRLREAAEKAVADERRLREAAEAREAEQSRFVADLLHQNSRFPQLLSELNETHRDLQIDLLDRLEPKPREPGEDGDGETVLLTSEQIENMHVVGKRGMKVRRQMLRAARTREAASAQGNKSEFASDADAPRTDPVVKSPVGDGSILSEGDREVLNMLLEGRTVKAKEATEAEN